MPPIRTCRDPVRAIPYPAYPFILPDSLPLILEPSFFDDKQLASPNFVLPLHLKEDWEQQVYEQKEIIQRQKIRIAQLEFELCEQARHKTVVVAPPPPPCQRPNFYTFWYAFDALVKKNGCLKRIHSLRSKLKLCQAMTRWIETEMKIEPMKPPKRKKTVLFDIGRNQTKTIPARNQTK